MRVKKSTKSCQETAARTMTALTEEQI